MPKISVIVSVHNSAEFLPTCLDSIIGQSFADLELIAVDDASTDASPSVLEHYASLDPRIQVVRLGTNVGAGGARNAALDRATGDYVWCVDSDDWLVPDALSAVVRVIDARGPEVLLIGFTRAYPDGTSSISGEQPVLKAAPPIFRLHEWVNAVDVLHVPWNKIVKRELIERCDFRFPPGWHQDLPYSYAMLSAASGISAIPEPLLIYRQHAGAATATLDIGHLCVLDQWTRTFGLVDRLSPQPEILRQPLLNRMAWHLTEQLKKPDRLPSEAWPEFARRAHMLWRSLVPDNYTFPRGLTGLKYRLIAQHPALVPLVPRFFALRRSIRRATGMRRGWDLSEKQSARVPVAIEDQHSHLTVKS